MNDITNKTNHKQYIIIKDKDDNDILDVKEYFEKPDKFLNINPKFTVGILPNYFNKKNKKEEKKTLLPLNKLKNSKKSRNSRVSRLLIKEDNSNTKSPRKDFYLLSYDNKNSNLGLFQGKKSNRSKNLISERNDKSENIHYKLKTFDDLKKIFHEGLKREKDSITKGTNYLIPVKTEINVKEKFFSQGKQLKYNSIYKSSSEKYFQNLAKRCKKNESQMLVNNVQNYRMKKQINDYKENNKILAEKFGDYYWLFSLRRSPKNDFTRLDYYNIGTNEREIWKRYMDYPDKDVELVNLPYSKGKKNLRFHTEINKEGEDNMPSMPKIKEFDDIKIEGKSLVKKEFSDIYDTYKTHNSNIKFKIYKDPKERDKKFVKDLIYKEIYQLKSKKNIKKIKLKLKLLNK